MSVMATANVCREWRPWIWVACLVVLVKVSVIFWHLQGHLQISYHQDTDKNKKFYTRQSRHYKDINAKFQTQIPTNYIIEEEDFCTRNPNIEVITYVHSAIPEVEKRMNTRRTWANSSICNEGAKLGVIFVVGKSKTKEEEIIVQKESEKYHDIVQGDYIDDYHLLSYKGLSSLYWVNKNCPLVPWTLHADDDIIIDTFKLWEVMQSMNETGEGRFVCKCLNGPVRRTGKWAVAKELFPLERYPVYCKGSMWLLATKEVNNILLASKETNYLWVDDAYLTGVLADVAGIGHRDLNEDFVEGKYKEEEIGRNISWYHLPEDNRLMLWGKILEHNNCSVPET